MTISPSVGRPNLRNITFKELVDAYITRKNMMEFARDGLVNVVGGCCGTTLDHTRKVVKAVEDIVPRKREKTESGDHMV